MYSPFFHPANMKELGTYTLVSNVLTTKETKNTNVTLKVTYI